MKKSTLSKLKFLTPFIFITSLGYAQCGTETATWDGTNWNWSGATPQNTVPTIAATTNVIINGDYYTNTGGYQTSFSACNLTVNAGFSLIIDDNTFVQVENNVSVVGNITVESKGAFVQNNDASSFTVNAGGTSLVRKITSVLNNWYEYTYWSPPVSGLTVATSPLTDSDRAFWFNASNYLDVLAEVGNTGVYNPGSDDIDDNGDDWKYLSASSSLTPGVGYAATHSQIGYFGPLPYSYEFNGPYNNGVITTPVVYNAANTGGHWNLIGNPYPSALDFDAFHAANSGVVTGAAYLWSQSSPLSETASGNQGLNFSQNDYVVINVGVGSTNNAPGTVEDYIPSGQGFFIASLSNGNVTFNNSMRMADGSSNNQFFKVSNSKSKSTITENKLWINLTTDNGVFNQILVGYVENATDGNDGMSFDTPRNLSSGMASIIYTLIHGETNKKYAIQGKSKTTLSEDEVIPVGFYTSIDVATEYKFSIERLQGDFLISSPIYIKDNLLNIVHDLSLSDYSFTSDVGEFNTRFEVVFSQASLSTDEFALNSKSLKIVELEDDRVQFTTTEDLSIKNINIYDLLGRQLYTFKGNSDSEIYSLSNISNSIYIAKVELSIGAVITKKAIKK